ncbi:agmatine deiminase family protein [Maribacter sp. HTCC2170]|uniref:agmatine deiminase family protein n=1 Tax=Maribacter sp. (strain HTCC2170 / KCCM 42371) TaxID=313603 RepID=UPI00006B479E|nr:agmatine deiminase family protein [Maribacter sp. HTCC2170]EAR01932.1 peptidylarginine deiminase [Maribacter sp. HTCC2170]
MNEEIIKPTYTKKPDFPEQAIHKTIVKHKTNMKPYSLFILLFFLISCNQEKKVKTHDASNFYSSNTNRVAAEWEPAKGVMFACPPIIPKELIIELAKDTHIYPIVDGEKEKAIAMEWFSKWEIDSTRITFIDLKMDSDIPYVRDWGPAAVFLKDGGYKLVDADFVNSDPFTDRACNDSLELHISKKTGMNYHSKNADSSIVPLANQLGSEVFKVPFTSTGGNVLTDGIGTAFSTCILLTENRFNGVSDEQFYSLNDSLLGYNNYHVTSNFESDGIQHIDCFLKIIDEQTLLVAQPPLDHELHDVYENIVDNELSKLKNPYGHAYTIKRIRLGRVIEEYLTAYTNSLILNKNVYVPLYGVGSDSLAIETWKSVMPGYTIKGLRFAIDEQPYLASSLFESFKEDGVNTGWGPDDALHCRTRAVWDSEAVFISVNQVVTELALTDEAIVYATIRDYSDQGIEDQGIKIHWRIKGNQLWNTDTMFSNNSKHHWYSMIPAQEKNTAIEYYVEITSKDGKSITRPMTAPKGSYEFKYVSQ